jgi:hypothetical protein
MADARVPLLGSGGGNHSSSGTGAPGASAPPLHAATHDSGISAGLGPGAGVGAAPSSSGVGASPAPLTASHLPQPSKPTPSRLQVQPEYEYVIEDFSAVSPAPAGAGAAAGASAARPLTATSSSTAGAGPSSGTVGSSSTWAQPPHYTTGGPFPPHHQCPSYTQPYYPPPPTHYHPPLPFPVSLYDVFPAVASEAISYTSFMHRCCLWMLKLANQLACRLHWYQECAWGREWCATYFNHAGLPTVPWRPTAWLRARSNPALHSRRGWHFQQPLWPRVQSDDGHISPRISPTLPAVWQAILNSQACLPMTVPGLVIVCRVFI